MRNILLSALLLGATDAAAQTAPLAPIEQSALASDALSTGLLSREAGALPADLWRGASREDLAFLLGALPTRPSSPAIGQAMRRVLLSPAESAPDGAIALGGAKLRSLAASGFVDEAREIEGLSSGTQSDPGSVEAMAIADLLAGDQQAACDKGRRVEAARDNSFWMRLRIVCYAAANELDAAELALGILGERGRLSEIDRDLLAPLASGGKPKAPVAPKDALHLAALKAMNMPISAGLLANADGGVVAAVARDPSGDWPTRLAAARLAAGMGVLGGAELKSLYAAAPTEAAPAFKSIALMVAPEFIRDKAARIAAEIAAAADFEGLYAASLLYADDIRAFEGAVVPAQEARAFALARLAAGDAIGAERWLTAATPAMREGADDADLMRFIDLVGILSVLDSSSGERVAALANVAAAKPPVILPPAPSATDRNLAQLVGAAIGAAREGARGASALAAIAASDAAARGDAVAYAAMIESFAAAGLSDIVRRQHVERAIAAIYPEARAAAAAGAATPASAPDGMVPRLKPKRET
ncbi:MAG: hypothetical protein HXY21_14140 [Parvularculaceae bacterium]|nr:hypothetical protein [Parvularculaceae bacterium]